MDRGRIIAGPQAYLKLARDPENRQMFRPATPEKVCITPPPQVPAVAHGTPVWTMFVDHRGAGNCCESEVFDLWGEFRVWLGDYQSNFGNKDCSFNKIRQCAKAKYRQTYRHISAQIPAPGWARASELSG